jgi:hypothetical protein
MFYCYHGTTLYTDNGIYDYSISCMASVLRIIYQPPTRNNIWQNNDSMLALATIMMYTNRGKPTTRKSSLKCVNMCIRFVSEYRLILETIGKSHLTGRYSTCSIHVLCAAWRPMVSTLWSTMAFRKKIHTRHPCIVDSIYVLVCYKRTTQLMRFTWLRMILSVIRSQK